MLIWQKLPDDYVNSLPGSFLPNRLLVYATTFLFLWIIQAFAICPLLLAFPIARKSILISP